VKSFGGKLAIVTGGATGIGRELVIQLASAGCSVATCDINEGALAETAKHARDAAPGTVRVTAHRCDVSDPAQVTRFRDEALARHETAHVNLLLNNAGITGGGSFVTDPADEWERTFNVCWGGVYNCSRAFLPSLIAADEACIANISSVNGFWAALGPEVPHTAYSTAKFAIKGFTESLLTDLRVNAPHVQVALIMPGHVGTDIFANSRRALGHPAPDDMTPEDLEAARPALSARLGLPPEQLTDDVVRMVIRAINDLFRDNASLTPAHAATAILDGIRAGTWRILVGDDAKALDEAARQDPAALYDPTHPLTSLSAAIYGAPAQR